MRKFKTMMAAVMMAALPMLLGSCGSDPYYYDDYWYDDWTWGNDYSNRPDDSNVSDEDFFVSMAQTLAGQWRGDMMAYELDDNGNVIDSLYYSTDIEFKQYNSQSISGTGTQYDYNPDTDELELKRNFSWYIDPETGNIYLNYKTQNSDGTTSDYIMSIAYDDLNLDNRTFTGYLWSNDGYEVDDFWFDRYTSTRASTPKNVKRIKFVMK
ncbi:MAG: hypothetical protein I3J02_09615 [Prevotella sp.]|nr:hypothetical protein [Prevotella sp.]